MMKIIDGQLLSQATQTAQDAPRLRANVNFHRNADDPFQRFLNAIEPSSYIRPHAHTDKDEIALALQGTCLVAIFTAEGIIERIVPIGAELDSKGLEVPANTFHTFISLSPGTVLFEAKAGPYHPENAKVFAEWAPEEGDEGMSEFREKIILAFTKERVLNEILMQGLIDRYYELKQPTKTAAQAAAALGVDVGQIAKSIVLLTEDGAALIVLLSGDRKVDVRKVKKFFGKKVRIASAVETLAATGYLVGSVSPFALLESVPIYVDTSLKGYSDIFPAAGGFQNGFRTSFAELTTLFKYERCDFAAAVTGE
ncbi:WbuC family cupin fold metalloprotein [Chrysiogenes arsenatis]|uniref:WbuC family cupin fold metalloprotein n=1 Tax=Chrysiogenes arsenatis TaxID=309797 RepID=UPI0003FE5978|nr:WbuC family cupin fold metalloprotein [Chrysiogenes arsenatis]